VSENEAIATEDLPRDPNPCAFQCEDFCMGKWWTPSHRDCVNETCAECGAPIFMWGTVYKSELDEEWHQLDEKWLGERWICDACREREARKGT
jgi:hypothetical protein